MTEVFLDIRSSQSANSEKGWGGWQKQKLVLSILLLLSMGTPLMAKNGTKTDSVKPPTLIYLENSETLSFDQRRLPDVQLLKGNVQFRHDDALMYCDSAYFYDGKNSLDAFGNVRIVQGDTLFVYGDMLYYNGNTKLARLRNRVRMENKQTVLTTDSLNYHRSTDLAYYFNGGQIKDSLNVLTSDWGQYHSKSEQAIFKGDVLLVNSNFTLETDTLHYNTESNIADLVAPTVIVYQEETTILSSNGWYNTATENSMLLDNSKVIHVEGRTLQGDTILYNKRIGFGEVFGHMQLTDSTQQTTLYGHYGHYNEITERGLATDSALLVEWSSEDWAYIHADTLHTEKDSIYNVVRGYYGVRVYRTDLQAVCDSLVYSERDSIMNLYRDPIMWNENNQVSADFIQVYMKDGAVDYAHLQNNALSIQETGPEYFNQMGGKEMYAYVKDKELHQVDVNGNAETIFYPKEDDGTFIGINKTQSSYVKLFIKDQKVERVLFTTATNGVMYPLLELTPEEARLSAFFWATTERPKDKDDVFSKPSKTPRAAAGPMSASAASASPIGGSAPSAANRDGKGQEKQADGTGRTSTAPTGTSGSNRSSTSGTASGSGLRRATQQ